MRDGNRLWLDTRKLFQITKGFSRRRPKHGIKRLAMRTRWRVTVFYAGRVQGVGFRYTVMSLSSQHEIRGYVRNRVDGRVELVAEGDREALEGFLRAIRDSGLGPMIQKEDRAWSESRNAFRGFEIR